ncbi:MAG: acyltransferase family protein [Rikenellaceae bacterium]|nr:acyltransferase family protein [Rikenellaceae bacterium]
MATMDRNRSLDGLKFILISLVVMGHFMEPSRYTDSVSCWLYSVIYSFHMPLFIWMNGYFYQLRGLGEELRKCIPLLEICAISHICFNLLVKGGCMFRTSYFSAQAPPGICLAWSFGE